MESERGTSDEVLLYYLSILKKEPNNRSALIHCGQIYLGRSQPDLAAHYFQQVVADSPDDAEALEGLGLGWLKQRRFAQAERVLSRSVSLDARRWNAWNGLGVVADMAGDFERAGSFYRKGLDVLPNYPPMLNNLGFSQLMAHHYRQAEATFRQGLRVAPDSLRLKNNLGLALAWQGNYKGGLQAISEASGEAVSYNNVGYIAMLKADYQQAEFYFRKAMQVSPRYYPLAAQNLKQLHQRMPTHKASQDKR